jgi:hypothetical protein
MRDNLPTAAGTPAPALCEVRGEDLASVEGGGVVCDVVDAIVRFVKGLFSPPPVGDFPPPPGDLA